MMNEDILAYAVLSYGTRYGTLCYESSVRLYNLYLKINPRIVYRYRIGWIRYIFKEKENNFPPLDTVAVSVSDFSQKNPFSTVQRLEWFSQLDGIC